MQSWHNDVSTSDKCLNYRLYKEYHGYGQYLDILSGYSCIQEFIYFRLCNNQEMDVYVDYAILIN